MAVFLALALGVPAAAVVFGPFAHGGWTGRLAGVLGTQCMALIAGVALEEQHWLAKAEAGEGGADGAE